MSEFENLEVLRNLLGKTVVVDFSKIEQGPYYKYPSDWDGKPFESEVVGINKMNCANNGFGDNNGEITIYPSHCGRNWQTIDIRMVEIIEK